MKLLTSFFIVLIISTSIAYCAFQQQNVTGTVTDAITGEPFPGVHVLIEGTQAGTLTDLNGKFSLPKPENGAILVFSFVGYTSERVTWSGQVVIDVKLSQDVKALDEVVVIGYGTTKKSDLTGSVASVGSKDIEKTKPVNVESALQGQVAGLMVTSNSGDPGSEGTIRIRGIGSVNNNSPIFVVDGMLIDNSDPNNPAGNISFLNPADITSIDVLKDASAQAIYGSRGANGVILITTRKGSEGAPKATFSSVIGFESVAHTVKVLNAKEYMDYRTTAAYNGILRENPGTDPNKLLDTIYNIPSLKNLWTQYNKGINTNWLDEVTRKNVLSQNYDLQLSGGTKDIHYSASIGYLNKNGILIESNYKRYSFRLNTDFKVGNYVTVGENLGISSSSQVGDWYQTSIIRNAMWNSPLDPILKPAGEVDPTDPDYEYDKYSHEAGSSNPVLQALLQSYPKSYLTIVGNMFGEATILKDLKLRSSFGSNIANRKYSHFTPKYQISATDFNELTSLMENESQSNGWIWENTLTWNKKLSDHSLSAVVGYTSEYTKATTQISTKKGATSNDPEMQTFDAATTEPNVTGGYNVLTMRSYLGRINYSFHNKYLLTASVRRDGSSKFAEGHQWGTFPSFSLGWRIDNEEFFKNLGADFISNLKLRAGWGKIGNSSLPVYYAYVSQIASSTNLTSGIDSRYIFGEKVYQGYALSTIGTPDITWETTEQTNIGLEIAILKNSLSLVADYYVKNTKNMLLQVPAVAYAGYVSLTPYSNAGSVQNKGFELLLNYQGKSGDFSYGVSVNGSMFKNKVVSLGNSDKPIISGYGQSRTEVGSSIGRFYGYVTDGIFQTENEVLNYKGPEGTVLQPNAHAGDIRFKNLNNDEAIDAKDETWIGDPWPKLTYGFNITLRYKAFDIVAYFQGSYGNDIYAWGRNYGNTLDVNLYEYYYKNAWHGPGTSNSVPILTTVQENDNYRTSDYYVEDGSYMRLQNIQLGFNLKKEICEKLKITDGRIWVGGTNLLTFTRYNGNDPEVGASNTPTLDAGMDYDSFYPKSREISIGINISF
jgi:TonB-linked SusC/RagA family outer membrane protein